MSESSHFKLKKITNLSEINENTIIPHSDFTLLTEDKFIQFTYHEISKETIKYPVSPGIFTINIENQELVLRTYQFTNEPLLQEYTFTKDITEKIGKFFSRIDIYNQYELFPKRAMLFWGSPGQGKSVMISNICRQYQEDKDTLVVIWPSNKIKPMHVKDFVQAFDYETNNVKKLILVIEDLGGIEVRDQDIPSDSSLLSLLDNVGQIFKVPTLILATTNHPENFLENLTDRPQRFDDVVEVKAPSADFRAKFLDFFSKNTVTEFDKEEIKNAKYDKFSVAHIKEIVVRSAIYDLSIKEAIDQIFLQSTKTRKGFTNKTSMGFKNWDDFK